MTPEAKEMANFYDSMKADFEKKYLKRTEVFGVKSDGLPKDIRIESCF